ncbi:MAG: hypothetical protein B7Y25_07905 [Alphaproteobacteria bacterium 16-39-46]|nr:MAG: hypothetical protein B7Y25_07905 [Alphaproteobacteria bacterium 16-39-46]OZA41388.1 MAG: hypothetical protein B7X84_08095 [Alphaproteobacteria bacterium 17-39-52]HQS84415.1 lasso peptide biosynthesis B2 protein [Alphaproteobacteria bacterium]HQS94231.1 lasso peptide biosynthesis B2 protein [Alphaproteobacteria bacterium]
MYYHLRDHIYVTQFRDELVLLDTKRDKYTICCKQISDLIISAIEKTQANTEVSYFSFAVPPTLQDMSTLQTLIGDNIIEEKDNSYPFYIDRKVDSDGVSNVDWVLPLENKKVRMNFSVVKALMTLIKVNFYIKVCGFYRTIRMIKKSRNSELTYIIPSTEELRDLANIVNKACLIYPTRTKCLEWAMTFVLLALRQRWKCNLEIGVQNYPFFAHAWVECDGKVVMDSQDLREGLGIVLNEPFRKLKV